MFSTWGPSFPSSALRLFDWSIVKKKQFILLYFDVIKTIDD